MENTSSPEERLLGKHDAWETESMTSEGQLRPKPSKRSFKRLLAVYALTVCLLPVAYFIGYNHGASQLPKLSTNAITKNGYKLRLQLLDDAFEVKDKENLKFKGRPRKELHEAWGGLLAHMNVRIRPDEVQKSPGFTSIEINDGSGDLAAFPTVFHSIHCLQTIREMFFPDDYPETWELFEPPTKGGIHPHMDHCIENLRQAIMCNADMSLYTYKWLPEQEEPDIVVGMEHVCADWDRLMDWAQERSFFLSDRLLKSPYRDYPWDPATLGVKAHNFTGE